MISPRVFVIQQPAKLDRNREWKPIFDIRPARKFGEFVFVLLRPGNVRLETLPVVIAHMQNILHDFGDEDFILPTGEPLAIATASMIAGQANEGRIKFLKWDKFTREYQIVAINTRN